MASNDRISKVLTVAVALCLVCSVVVSSAAVLLRDAQEANKARDKKSNISAAAGLLEPDMSVEEQFEKIEVKMVDIATGKFTDVVSPDTYEQRKAAKNPELSVSLSKEEDVAGISAVQNMLLCIWCAMVMILKRWCCQSGALVSGQRCMVLLPLRVISIPSLVWVSMSTARPRPGW